MRRHFENFRPVFQGDFEGFLRYAVEHSKCNQYAVNHYKHCASDYVFDGDIGAYHRDLERWSNE